jgi:hypothetical protein
MSAEATKIVPTVHATLGASSAHRWMNCAGSVRLSADIPRQPSSPHAKEGTAAHELAAETLLEGGYCADRIGNVYVVEGEEFPVTEEMAEAVQVYVDAVNRSRGALAVHVEERIDLAPLNPPQPMFGTADGIIWKEEEKVLEVWDLKFGRGVFVGVEDNVQLLYYALGAVVSFLMPKKVRPDTVRINIVQPRAGGEPVRSTEITWTELVEFKKTLFDAAEATTDPEAPLNPGDHCRWCPAIAVCPAQAGVAVEVAQQEFGVMEEATLPSPELLTEEQILEVLDKAELIRTWLSSLEDHVKSALERGEAVPGWKLVNKRATRRWVDEEAAERWLRRKIGAKRALTKKVLSPAQAEKELKADGEELPEKYVEAKSSGFNMVREDNPKPAVTPGDNAADEFSLPASTD